MTLLYSIEPKLFEKFPGYLRGVVIARGLANGKSPDDLVTTLRQAEGALPGFVTQETITSHPHIEPWREAYRASGVKPSEYRPSMEALVRRVLRQDPLPAINTIVDLGNLVSIRRLVPVGAHAIDVLTGNIDLKFAGGSEVFEPFGAETSEHPAPGEIVFVEGNVVLTRRWTWRQSKHTLVVPETTAVEINVDALPPVDAALVSAICEELIGLLQKYCGGTARFDILSRSKPMINLD